MLGIILSFGSAMAFACNSIITRRGVLRASSDYVANVSILTGTVFSLMVAFVAGNLYEIGAYSWKAFVLFALSGIIHFAFGRTWSYKSVQLIGSNRSHIITGLNPIVSIVSAVIIFGETVNTLMVVGIACSLLGPFITMFKEQTVASDQIQGRPRGKDVDRRTLFLGMLYGAGTAVCWGSSIVFIKFGLENGGSPLAGNLIAYVSASIAVLPSIVNKKNKSEMLAEDWNTFKLAALSGITSNIAQLLKYCATAYASVIIVTAIGRTSPLGTLLLSYIFNRQYESFSRWVLVSNALLIIGTFLILKA